MRRYRQRRYRQARGLACAGLGWLAACAAAPVAAGDCTPSAARSDSLARLGPRGELVLASGARAVLDGVRWPDDDAVAAQAGERLMRAQGAPLTLIARGETDRWGRARVDAVAEASPVDLAGELVEAGLVAVDSGEGDALCRPALLSVEAGARAAGRGIWSAPNQDARDGAALRARMGRFVVAEGRVLNVGERPARTYLDFARRGEDGLTVTVSKRTWRQMRERGFTAAKLKGRRVRARGVMEAWRGPTLDIASADMIEVLESQDTPSRSQAQGPAAEGGTQEREQAPRR